MKFLRRKSKKPLTPQQLAKRKRRRRIRNIIRLTVVVLLIIFLYNPVRSLMTLEKVSDYPLYTMHWRGGYGYLGPLGKLYNHFNRSNNSPTAQKTTPVKKKPPVQNLPADPNNPSGCTLFTALGNPENAVFGRNFDWTFSPLLLLFTDPDDGYASVTVVDIAYLGFDEDNAKDPPWYLKLRLWLAPAIPFEGINEHGLTIATASVSNLDPKRDPAKEDMMCLGIIRVMLDKARNVEEALALMQNYNITFPAGPNVHYLLADCEGHAAVVEVLADGSLAIFRNTQPWQVATNHYLATNPDKKCFRMARCNQVLGQAQGKLTADEAMNLLERVRIGCTVWSLVYEMKDKKITICLDGDFKTRYTFTLGKD
ncbi:MAG: linear amide C-N hydrolase [Sedimentisphaerales bacterium]|nr:linear amide C-N hydrolase [Sedimentisphaerales bacterium]